MALFHMFFFFSSSLSVLHFLLITLWSFRFISQFLFYTLYSSPSSCFYLLVAICSSLSVCRLFLLPFDGHLLFFILHSSCGLLLSLFFAICFSFSICRCTLFTHYSSPYPFHSLFGALFLSPAFCRHILVELCSLPYLRRLLCHNVVSVLYLYPYLRCSLFVAISSVLSTDRLHIFVDHYSLKYVPLYFRHHIFLLITPWEMLAFSFQYTLFVNCNPLYMALAHSSLSYLPCSSSVAVLSLLIRWDISLVLFCFQVSGTFYLLLTISPYPCGSLLAPLVGLILFVKISLSCPKLYHVLVSIIPLHYLYRLHLVAICSLLSIRCFLFCLF